MSLDKAIKHGKEHREDYKGSKRFDRTCRNHGSCNRCECDRTFSKLKINEVEKLIEDEDLTGERDYGH
jgi:hypothetical protein